MDRWLKPLSERKEQQYPRNKDEDVCNPMFGLWRTATPTTTLTAASPAQLFAQIRK